MANQKDRRGVAICSGKNLQGGKRGVQRGKARGSANENFETSGSRRRKEYKKSDEKEKRGFVQKEDKVKYLPFFLYNKKTREKKQADDSEM